VGWLVDNYKDNSFWTSIRRLLGMVMGVTTLLTIVSCR